jgi:hypothetical protein
MEIFNVHAFTSKAEEMGQLALLWFGCRGEQNMYTPREDSTGPGFGSRVSSLNCGSVAVWLCVAQFGMECTE